MDLMQTNALLVQVSAIDRRKVSDAMVMAWQEVLANVDYADACAALVTFRRVSVDYLQPAHLVQIVDGWHDELPTLRAREADAKQRWLRGSGMTAEAFDDFASKHGYPAAIGRVSHLKSIQGASE